METRKQKIDKLDKKITLLKKEQYELIEEEERLVVLPKLHSLVGVCLKSEYGGNTFAKLLEIVDSEKKGIYFLMETFDITEQGSVNFQTASCYPYTNKEWWGVDVPISGWKRITDKEYKIAKKKAEDEFSSMNKLRKFVKQ